MAKLILSFEGTIQKTFLIDKERMTLGRRPENDIQVDNLAVSGAHAVVLTLGGDTFLEDLASTNGTFVNGEPIYKHLLRAKDVIELGKHTLTFVPDPPRDANQNFDKTLVIRRPPKVAPGAPPPKPASASAGPATVMATPMSPATVMAPPTPMPARSPAAPPPPPLAPLREAALHVLSGSAAGRSLALSKPMTKLGGGGQVAVIARRPTGYFITHVAGDTQPLINKRPIGNEPRQLNEHDTIEIAGTQMRFEFVAPAA
jgi:pSer/pThr/pTyr-binding forkhead associated (FHA) protein